MLSAVRAMAHRVAHDLAHMERPRLDPGRHACRAGRAHRRGARARAGRREGCGRPRPRPARDAARGRRGGRRRLRADRDHRRRRRRLAREPRRRARAPDRGARHAAPAAPRGSREFRYCTNFAVTGLGLDAPVASCARLEELGDSVLVVGDERTLRVHVHTDEPERAVALFEHARRGLAARRGRHARADRRPQRPRERRGRGRPGDAVRRRWRWPAAWACPACTRGSARTLLDGGPTMNPSTYELLAGIHDRARRGGRRAAQQPQRDHGRGARGRAVREARAAWCPPRRPRKGLAALLSFDPREAREPNAAARGGGDRGLRARRRRAGSAKDDPQGRFSHRRRGGLRRRRAGGLGRAGGRPSRATLRSGGRRTPSS